MDSISVTAAARRLGYHRSHVYVLITTGKLVATTDIKNSALRVPEAEVARFLREPPPRTRARREPVSSGSSKAEELATLRDEVRALNDRVDQLTRRDLETGGSGEQPADDAGGRAHEEARSEGWRSQALSARAAVAVLANVGEHYENAVLEGDQARQSDLDAERHRLSARQHLRAASNSYREAVRALVGPNDVDELHDWPESH